MLQSSSIAGEILIENICHLSFKNEHSGEDIPAVSLSLLLVKWTVCENWPELRPREYLSKVGIQRIFPGLVIIPGTRLLYPFFIHLERVTGIEPALAYWIYAGQDLKSCVLPLHYTRLDTKIIKYDEVFSHVLSFGSSRSELRLRYDHLLLPYPRRSPEESQSSREKTWLLVWWDNIEVREEGVCNLPGRESDWAV